MDFTLPDELTEIQETKPTDIVIISVPKMGKTAILSELTQQKNAVIFNLEKNGTIYNKGRFINIYPESTTSVRDAIENYKGYRDALLKQKGKYDFLIIDTLSALSDLSEIMGTLFYMNEVPQGKNFNRDAKGNKYDMDDPRFQSVHTLPEGYGYRWSREWFFKQIDIFTEIAPYRIYTAHIKDKMLKNAQDEVVNGIEIDLTGKVKGILASKVSTLCRMVSDGDKRYLSFVVDNDNIIAGSRAPSLTGQILISEKKDGKIITHWDNIYK